MNKIKTVGSQPTNFELLILSHLVYNNINLFETKIKTLKDDLCSDDFTYLENTSGFKSEIAKDGLLLAEAIKKAKLNEWVIYDVKEDCLNGFFGVIFKNTTTNKFVVSFRGTKTLSDIPTDFTLALTDLENTQVESAKELLCKLPNRLEKNDIILTGHSLGGYLGSRIGAEKGYKTVVFNPPGYHANYLKSLRDKGIFQYEDVITNYNIEGDLISEWGEHVGNVIIFPKRWYWFFPETQD